MESLPLRFLMILGGTAVWLGLAIARIGGFAAFLAHPALWALLASYLGMLIYCASWSLAFRSGVGPLLTVSLLPPLIARMNAEERLLQAQFGEEYAAYRAGTCRLLPGVYQE